MLFMIVNTIYFGFSDACKKNQVIIQNQLEPDRVLEYHCRSKDDDLQVHTMNFNATPFIIRFHDAIAKLTTWACIFRQGPNMEYSYDIIVYKAADRFIFTRCGQKRIWVAKIDGIYFSNTLDKLPWRVLSWNKK